MTEKKDGKKVPAPVFRVPKGFATFRVRPQVSHHLQ